MEVRLRARLKADEFSDDFWQSFSERLHYVSTDALDAGNWQGLKKILEGYDERTRIFYLATAPKLFGAIARGLSQNGLINWIPVASSRRW